ncbi:nucleoside monophosphate kinase [Patescibacteria group bacterium]|nr:MAG: nucleoside monophosphate kinase [Patescibacteria group bacterium]
MAPVVAIMGPIGSGKSVQARILAEELGWQAVSTGSILREHIKEPGIDPAVVAALNAGHLVPSPYVHKVLLEKLRQLPADTGIVLDGSPRKPGEVHHLNEDLPALGRKLNLVILLKLSREQVEQRLAKRGRHDDQPETIKVRWAEYERDTLPTIELCRQQGLLREVDADAEPAVVQQRILEVLHAEHLA